MKKNFIHEEQLKKYDYILYTIVYSNTIVVVLKTQSLPVNVVLSTNIYSGDLLFNSIGSFCTQRSMVKTVS